MPPEDLDIVRRLLTGALTDPDSVWEIYGDEVEWDLTGIAAAPDFPRISCGPDAIREFFRRWVGAFDEWGYEAEELIDGPEAVVTRIHQWGRGKGSGAPVDNRFWQVWTLREGKAVRVFHTSDRAEALEAAGLRDSAAPGPSTVE